LIREELYADENLLSRYVDCCEGEDCVQRFMLTRLPWSSLCGPTYCCECTKIRQILGTDEPKEWENPT
jgi:hypothetical protein